MSKLKHEKGDAPSLKDERVYQDVMGLLSEQIYAQLMMTLVQVRDQRGLKDASNCMINVLTNVVARVLVSTQDPIKAVTSLQPILLRNLAYYSHLLPEADSRQLEQQLKMAGVDVEAMKALRERNAQRQMGAQVNN